MKPFVSNKNTPTFSCVYSLTNLVNGRKYYGETSHLKQRMVMHHANLKTRSHCCNQLLNDFELYGADSFELSVIYVTKNRIDRRLIEKVLVRVAKNPYNHVKSEHDVIVNGVKFVITK